MAAERLEAGRRTLTTAKLIDIVDQEKALIKRVKLWNEAHKPPGS